MRFFLLPTGIFTVVTLIGCSAENDAGSIGESLGKNVTEFAQGVGSGVDTQLEVKIELSQELTNRGVTTTVAKQETPLNDATKPITVYFISAKPIDAALVAKAYNADNQEIGRATTTVAFGSDDAQHVGFEFPPEMDRQLVDVYRIGIRDKVTESAESPDSESGDR
ncbi:MAG: hypothetical protein AB8G99_03305 [Planctomycetaceae bacterium]